MWPAVKTPLVDHSTELEGLAVYAARPRRAAEHILLSDSGYVALESVERMRMLEQRYHEQYRYLKDRGNPPAEKEAPAVIDRMSSGDRLWYRVRALMAGCVEVKRGHAALISLITRSHPALSNLAKRDKGDLAFPKSHSLLGRGSSRMHTDDLGVHPYTSPEAFELRHHDVRAMTAVEIHRANAYIGALIGIGCR